MEIVIVVILLVLGIVFLLLEIFMFPGISVAGIAGGLFTAAAVWYAYTYVSPLAGNLTLGGGAVLLIVAIWAFMRSKALDKMSLQTNITGKVDSISEEQIKIGDRGITLSRLAPMGKVKINGTVVEAKTNDEFLDQNVEVVVKQVFSTNILVEKI